jgi:hypothetical protein
MIGGDHRASARHVLHDDDGVTGDIAAQMARDDARHGIEAAAGRSADKKRYGFISVVRILSQCCTCESNRKE